MTTLVDVAEWGVNSDFRECTLILIRFAAWLIGLRAHFAYDLRTRSLSNRNILNISVPDQTRHSTGRSGLTLTSCVPRILSDAYTILYRAKARHPCVVTGTLCPTQHRRQTPPCTSAHIAAQRARHFGPTRPCASPSSWRVPSYSRGLCHRNDAHPSSRTPKSHCTPGRSDGNRVTRAPPHRRTP
jgi:hypothetical protein